jgi:hypothetical protein
VTGVQTCALPISQTTEGDPNKTVKENNNQVVDETLKDDLIEDKPFTPCEGGRKITAEEVVNLPSVNDFYTQWVIDFPETSYDYYLCDEESGDLRAIPKEESNPLNEVDGGDKEENEVWVEQETLNKLSQHCDTEGFDCKKGNYTVRFDQTIQWVSAPGAQTMGEQYKKIKIPKGTKVYLRKNPTDQSREVILGQSISPSSSVNYGNTVKLYCLGNENNSTHFSVPKTNGLTDNFGFYKNDALFNVLYKVFCKDNNNLKSWNELTNCKDCN